MARLAMSHAPRHLIFPFVIIALAVGLLAWWSTQVSERPKPGSAASSGTSTAAAPGPASAPDVHGSAPTLPGTPALATAQPTAPGAVAPATTTPAAVSALTAAVAPAQHEVTSSPPAPPSPTTAALVEAHQTGKHAEQTSPLLAPPPFDAEAFTKDPQPYLTQSVPGRVFQTAAPGPGVPVLASRGRALAELAHGESCDLAVKAPAGSPVTFTTFDLGTVVLSTNLSARSLEIS